MSVVGRPVFAMAFGAFILCAETCNHLDSILRPAHWYDLPIYDWSAGLFLLGAGAMARRDPANGRPYLAAAWGFMVSLLAGAFFSNWEEWSREPQADEWLSPRVFAGILAGLLAAGVSALVSTVRPRR